MKKILTITFLVLLTVGLFVACNADAVETVFDTEEGECLCFTAVEEGATVTLKKIGDPTNGDPTKTISLVYSYDGEKWEDYTIGEPTSATNVGGKVYFKAKNSNATFSKDEGNYYYFDIPDKKMSCSGNIMFLLNSTGKSTTVPEYCFVWLFYNCDTLTEAPVLPAITLGEHCYENMFAMCSALTKAPELPALFLAKDCYHQMFAGTSLTEAPALPATTLADECYWGMFMYCSSLTTAPELPATTLAYKCYADMFEGCTALTKAPELPTTTLAGNCYGSMFMGCTALETAPARLPAETLAEECYSKMFSGCSSLKTAPELPALTLAEGCYKNMFSGCSSLITAPELPAETLADNCYYGMFENCTLTTAPKLPATTLAKYCYHQMFKGCSSLTTAPELPAETLDDHCYDGMFQYCTALTTVPARLPASTLKTYCYQYMFDGCSSLTEAPALPATTLTESCYVSMFQGCSSLNSVIMLATDDLSSASWFTNWLSKVASTGTIYVDSTKTGSLIAGSYGIPSEGWTVKTATWSVIGDFAGFSWNKDFMMTETETKVFESPVITFKAGDQFKVRRGLDWEEGDYGAPTDGASPFVFTSGTSITATNKGYNIAVPADGNYTITLDLSKESNPTITVTAKP